MPPSPFPESRSRSLISREADFWLLGGASILIWGVMTIAHEFRDSVNVVQNHFLQVGAMFSILSILCNFPHFMLSYQLAYSRGLRFTLKNWFPMLLIPVLMIAWFVYAYFNYAVDISDSPMVSTLNRVMKSSGTIYRFGTLGNLGTEFLSLSVWSMFITVGWHYSKQVFGCMMVYAAYDQYPLSLLQRRVIKLNLFSIAFFNFFSNWAYTSAENPVTEGTSNFYGVPLANLGISDHLVQFFFVLTVVLSISVVGILFWNFKKSGKKPTVNFLIAWLAFHIWWIPLNRHNEYYFLVVPFFHSLQYLPFGYRLERVKTVASQSFYNLTARFSVLVFLGFCGFELIPNLLDRHYDTMEHYQVFFFFVALPVFINVHHFFIDSVVWKFDHPSVKNGLFQSAESLTAPTKVDNDMAAIIAGM
jgi:hypothetical protein